MSIERTQSSASEAARAREGTSEGRERAPANREQTDRFRNALDGARQGVQPQSQQQAQRSGFTGSVGSQQSKYLPFTYLKI